MNICTKHLSCPSSGGFTACCDSQRVLLWFCVDEGYVDFILNELDNVLALHGVDPRSAYDR